MSSNNLYVHHQQERLIIIIRIDNRRLKVNSKFNGNTLIIMEAVITAIAMASVVVVISVDPVVKVAAVAKEVEAEVVHHRRDNNI